MIAALPVPVSATAPVLKGVAATNSRSSGSEPNGFAHALAQADLQASGGAASSSACDSSEISDKFSDPPRGSASDTQTADSAGKVLLDSHALLSPGGTDAPIASDDVQTAPESITAPPLSPLLVSDIHQRSISVDASLKDGKNISGGQLQKECTDKTNSGRGKISGMVTSGNQSPAVADVPLLAASTPVNLPQSATTLQQSRPSFVQDSTVGTPPETVRKLAQPPTAAAQRPQSQSVDSTSSPPQSAAFSETLLTTEPDKPAAYATAAPAAAAVTAFRASADLASNEPPPGELASSSQPLSQSAELSRASRADSRADIGSAQMLQPSKLAKFTDQRSPATPSNTQPNDNGAAFTLPTSGHVPVLPATVHPVANAVLEPVAISGKVESSPALQPAMSSATNLLGVDAARTVHDARGGGLEVGFHDGTLGWLSIRASVGTTGDLSATVGSRSQAASSAVSSMLPALGRFLQQENISVHSVSAAIASAALPSVAGGSGASLSHSGGGLPADASGQAGAGADPGSNPKRDRSHSAWARNETLPVREPPADYAVLPGIASARQSGASLLSVRI